LAHRRLERYLVEQHADDDPIVLIAALSYAIVRRLRHALADRSDAELDRVLHGLTAILRRHVRFVRRFDDDDGPACVHLDPIPIARAPASTPGDVSRT